MAEVVFEHVYRIGTNYGEENVYPLFEQYRVGFVGNANEGGKVFNCFNCIRENISNGYPVLFAISRGHMIWACARVAQAYASLEELKAHDTEGEYQELERFSEETFRVFKFADWYPVAIKYQARVTLCSIDKIEVRTSVIEEYNKARGCPT